LAYDGERADSRALDQLETILRHVADELSTWHSRAIKTETELREQQTHPRAGVASRPDPEVRARIADLEQENKQLRQRVEAARVRVGELLARLTFLEDQAREQAAGIGARPAGAKP
jgi:hypothetical protein